MYKLQNNNVKIDTASKLYQINGLLEKNNERHIEFHHENNCMYGRSRSFLEKLESGIPCPTVLSPPRVLNLTRPAPSLNLNDMFYCTCINIKLHQYLFIKFLRSLQNLAEWSTSWRWLLTGRRWRTQISVGWP